MHEEMIAYWSRASVVADLAHGDRRLVILRVPPDMEHERRGTAQCSVSRDGRLEGTFWLRRGAGGMLLDGYLCPNLDEMYRFGDRQVSESTDWPELLAFVRQALDFNYKFPQELGVQYQLTGLTAKLGKARE